MMAYNSTSGPTLHSRNFSSDSNSQQQSAYQQSSQQTSHQTVVQLPTANMFGGTSTSGGISYPATHKFQTQVEASTNSSLLSLNSN